MAETKHEKKVHGIVAEFTSVDTLLAACRRIRDAGYTKIDAFTPFAVHGIDEALGIKPTVLPWIALVGGVVGAATGMAMQIWMIGINYPYIISGKPYVSLPAFVPIAFELTILFASFCAFFGMWALNGLPKFSNPMFTNPRFDRATDDGFFLYVDAADQRYDAAGVQQLLSDAGGTQIEKVVDDETSSTIPRNLIVALAVLIALSLIPALLVAKMRVATSSSPRFHIFLDMDLSPAKDAQQTTTLFSDDLAMRPDVPGTIARGDMAVDLNHQTGIDMDALAAIDARRAERLVAAYPQQQEGPAPEGTQGTQGESPAGAQSAAEDNTPWLEQNPLELTTETLQRGRQQFEIYCAVCHGINGRGNGLVNQRALKILAATWIPPANLHATEQGERVYAADQYPDGKLFNTISYGIRKMPGYASQISTRDRWAIVGYVRALQRSQNASLELVPEDRRDEIVAKQAEVQQQLKEQAEAERKRQQQAEQQQAEQQEPAQTDSPQSESPQSESPQSEPSQSEPSQSEPSQSEPSQTKSPSEETPPEETPQEKSPQEEPAQSDEQPEAEQEPSASSQSDEEQESGEEPEETEAANASNRSQRGGFAASLAEARGREVSRRSVPNAIDISDITLRSGIGVYTNRTLYRHPPYREGTSFLCPVYDLCRDQCPGGGQSQSGRLV